MGNTQCGFLVTSSNQYNDYQLISQQKHQIFGQITHVKTQKSQEHFAIKRIYFNSEKQYLNFNEFVQNYIKLPQNLPYLKILKVDGIADKNKQKNTEHNNQDKFKCSDVNIFKSHTQQQQQISCRPSQIKRFLYTIHLQYFPYQNHNLQHIIYQKNFNFEQYLQSNKIAKNMQFDIFQKLKLNQYLKIDQLPPKQRKFVNHFYNQIQILRMLDCMISALYGVKVFDINSNKVNIGVSPDLMFKNQEGRIIFLLNYIVQKQNNIDQTIENLKKIIASQRSIDKKHQKIQDNLIISYLHPQLLLELPHFLSQNLNIKSNTIKISNQMYEKQNIFALGLIMIQLCLFEQKICSKIYQINFKQKQKTNQFLKFGSGTITSSCIPKQTYLQSNFNIKLKQNIVKKYLSQIKVRYSQDLVELIQKMIFNSSNEGFSNYQNVITKLTKMIKQNIEKLKKVYGSTKVSRNQSIQKTRQQSKSKSRAYVNNSPNQSSGSNLTIPTLSYSSSYSLLPLQSHQPVLSFELLRKYYKKVQKQVQNIITKQQIAYFSENPLQNQHKLQELIVKDQKRILKKLNKLNSNYNTNTKIQIQSLKKPQENSIKPKNNKQNIGIKFDGKNIHLNNKKNQQSKQKQKRINSTQKNKKIQFQKTYQQLMLGSISCQTISEKSINNHNTIKQENQPFKNPIQNNIQSYFEHSSSNGKSQLKNLIRLKNQNNKNNLGQKVNQINQKKVSQVNSEKLYQIYMKEYQQILQKQKLTF